MERLSAPDLVLLAIPALFTAAVSVASLTSTELHTTLSASTITATLILGAELFIGYPRRSSRSE